MRYRTLNLIAACACLACAIAYTAKHGSLVEIATCVALGIANIGFMLVE